MSDHDVKMTKTTPQQFFFALWGGLFAPIIAIALIVGLVAKIQGSHSTQAALAYNDQAVEERIHPVGEVNVVDANAVHVDKEGEQVFGEVCTACHTPGALGAPKFGDKAAWGPRIKQGYETLIKHAIEGIRQMPARGGNPDLTDTEIARAVAYMANDAGAKFTPPAAAAPAAPAAAAPAAPAADAKKM
ncbi:c-type cytochrome [Sulfuriferula thiophila]|uniref:c-type cytochrome n=1 Tax=Sulfuriferula thiophila TaxID=1781211 RepID=UPI000F60B507|nr:c-type cytochrome [Sulfuriferula thiophila]